MTSGRPLYLDLAPDPVFAMYHEPTAGPAASGVVVVPPWGWYDVASYRSRRDWAIALAELGHPVVRIDLPGSGDSGGGPGDPARVAAWVAAVDGAAAWLRAEAGVQRIAVLGLGLGGLVAAAAIDRGAAIDDLVLWATPSTGRQLVRQERVFAGTQGARYSLTGEPEPRLLPDGWLEVNGFVLSAETIADLEALDLRALGWADLRRALLLETDGLPTDDGLAQRLTEAGVAVERRPGPGWAAMTVHPERADLPTEVMATVAAWLAVPVGERPTNAAHDRRPPVAREAATIQVGETMVRESPVWVPSSAGQLFGLLAEPTTGTPRGPVGAVFLNAGAVRRIGPDRIWVETARRWAARGVPVLRVDLEGIGDSDGDSEPYRDVAAFYTNQDLADQVRAFTDVLLARGGGPRIALAGLCAGGFWAFTVADRDPRVSAAWLVNPAALVWHDDLVRQRNAGRLRRLRERAWWRRLLRGQVRRARIRAIAGAALRGPVGRQAAPDQGSMLARLRAREVDVLLAFSADEPLEAELRAGAWYQDPDAWPNLHRARIPGRDHTLRPIVAQRATGAALDEALDRELARAAATDASVEPRLTTAGAR